MTIRTEKAYRHFNAFLQHYQCKQLFWRAVQKKANCTRQTYLITKTKLLCCSRPQEWVLHACNWLLIPLGKENLSWRDLHMLWDEYCHNHNHFIQ